MYVYVARERNKLAEFLFSFAKEKGKKKMRDSLFDPLKLRSRTLSEAEPGDWEEEVTNILMIEMIATLNVIMLLLQ